MLTVIKNSDNEVVYKSNKPLTIETINIENELKSFNPDKFIEDIRKKQQDEKKKNKEKFEHLKAVAKEKGYSLNDDGFLPEYSKEPCYGGNMGSVLTLEKDGLTIDIWANGEQRYNVFDDEAFCRFLEYYGVRKGILSRESAEKLRKAVYYCMKLSLDGIFPRNEYFNPVEEILNGGWLPLNDEEKHFLCLADEDDCFELHVNKDMYPDRLPIGWYIGYYYCGNNNWIEIFFDKDGNQINEGDVYDGDDLLDALQDMDELYKLGLEYLEEA